MEELFVRVDERLLHGQVTLGWASHLQPEVLMLANDLAAEDSAQRRLIEALDVEGSRVQVQGVTRAGHFLRDHPEAAAHTLVVVCSPEDALDLRRAGAPFRSLNLGGMYQAPGRRRCEDFLWLSRQDIDTLLQLVRDGVEVEARDLPATPPRILTVAYLQHLRQED
jgi:mannose/fructose/N-acetylgalactosamine-specific phosphotransferase system component IIB